MCIPYIKNKIHVEFYDFLWGRYSKIYIYICLVWKVIYRNILKFIYLYTEIKSKKNIFTEEIHTVGGHVIW